MPRAAGGGARGSSNDGAGTGNIGTMLRRAPVATVLLSLLLQHVACSAGVVQIDVLPSGAAESASGVVTTLHEAQRRARAAVAAGHDAIVTLKPGTHHLLRPLRFGGEDSGGSGGGGRTVCYQADPAAPLGTVAVSGGAPLPKGCWKKGEAVAGGTVYKCELPAEFPVKFFEQLFVNGKRCPRARFPNFDPLNPTVDGTGYFNVAKAIAHLEKDRWPSLGDAGITFDPESFSPRQWVHPANNATLHMFPWGHSSWGNLIYDGIERLNDTLMWKRGGWHINTHEFPNGDKPHGGGRFFVEAVREELDAEWEWFLDVRARTVELVAPAGLDLETADVVAPTVAQPFEHVGASGVHIAGLNITHTAAQYMAPGWENPSRGDWTIFRGGAVYFENSHNCSVSNCFFDQVGSNGVMVSERNTFVDIDKCRFVAAGSSAVAFVGNRHKAHGTYEAFPTDCSVTNSYMAELGYFDKQVAGVFISNSQRINVSHNMVRNVPRAGILMNDGLVGGHDIAYNHVWNSVRDTSDHGPFNSWGRERYWDLAWSHGPGMNGVFPSVHAAGDVQMDVTAPVLLRSNLLAHGPQSSDYACADLDDGSSNIITSSNIMIGCAMKNREGDLRTTVNNLIMGDEMNEGTNPHNLRFELTMMNNSDSWTRNIMLDLGDAPHVSGVSPANIKYVNKADPILPKVNDYNCVQQESWVNPQQSAHGYGNPGGGADWNFSKAEWTAKGMDVHSVFSGDLKLDRQTFQLGAESPCLKIPGLQQLETTFGLELEPWGGTSAAVFNVRTSRCSAKNTGQQWMFDEATGKLMLAALSSPPGCLMTESILLQDSLSTAVYPCDAEGRLGLGTWKMTVVGNTTKFQLSGKSALLGKEEYCLGAWIARGVSNARLVSCADPSATWAGVHSLGAVDGAASFHLGASAAQAASPPQRDFARTECLDACHKGECVHDVSPTIVYE